MNVLKTFKSDSRSNTLPYLFNQSNHNNKRSNNQHSPQLAPVHGSQSPAPRTNLTNMSQTIIRPTRPPSYSHHFNKHHHHQSGGGGGGSSGYSSSRSTMTRSTVTKRRMRSNLLLFFTIIGCFAGIALGAYARTLRLKPVEKAYFGFPGELFLRMLKFAIVPLIASSLVCDYFNLTKF